MDLNHFRDIKNGDLIILVGLDPVELISQPWAYTTPVLDICARIHKPHYLTPAARLSGPLQTGLTALEDHVSASAWALKEIAGYRDTYINNMAEPETGGLSSTVLVKAVRDAFTAAPRHSPRLCVDAGAHMFSACAFWPASQPRDLLISNGLATMGFALPAAIAAALHDPERGAIAMTGDGGLMMCLGELKTAVETGADITVIVFNDGRFSLIDIKRESRQMPDQGLTWTPPDFAAMASGFGLQSWRAESLAELTTALTVAAQTSGPRLIDVHIDASGYGDQIRALRG